MKSKLKNSMKYLVFIFIISITLFLSFTLTRNYSFIEKLIKDNLLIIVSPLIAEAKEPLSESYLIQKNINSSLEKEVKELKELLSLTKTLTEYKTENATVISRNNAYWFNTIIINKGKKAGIKKDMAVITKAGLIGKISKVSNNSSEVKLLTTNDITYKTSVVIRMNDKDHYAILNGYDSKTNLLKLTGIDKSTSINQGDIVLTSGLGAMPQGIYIGTVEKEEIDNYNLSKIVYIKTNQDFNNIHYVTVLKENN